MNIRPNWSLQSDVWGSWDGREASPPPQPLFPHSPMPPLPPPLTPTPSFPPKKNPIPPLPPPNPHAPTPTPPNPHIPTPTPRKSLCPDSHPPTPTPKPTSRRKMTPQNYRCLFQAYLQELSRGSCNVQLNNRCMTFCGNVRDNELLVITHFWHCLGDP